MDAHLPDFSVYRPAGNRPSFERWLFSALPPLHRRAVMAGLLVLAPDWRTRLSGTGFGRAVTPELAELRLHLDADAVRVRPPRGFSRESERDHASGSRAIGRCRLPARAVLHAFFLCRGTRIVVLSGGLSDPRDDLRYTAVPGLFDARWRLRELESDGESRLDTLKALKGIAFEGNSFECPATLSPWAHHDQASTRAGPGLLDFAAVYAQVRREAALDSAAAVAELNALEDRFRLASTVIARRRAANLTKLELARRAGLDASKITHLERATANPTLQTIGAVARALDTEICLRPRAS